MSIDYEVSGDGTFVHTRATGMVTESDLLRHEKALVSDRRIKPGFQELFDATMATQVGITDGTFTQVMDIDKAHPEKFRGTRRAIVVQKPVESDLAKRYERIYDGPARLIVFYNLDVAQTWLGCDAERESVGKLRQ